MKLEDKFKNAEERYFKEALIQKCVEIADTHAVEFAEWVDRYCIQTSKQGVYFKQGVKYSTVELLVLYNQSNQ